MGDQGEASKVILIFGSGRKVVEATKSV